jgi:replicative DNA helicase
MSHIADMMPNTLEEIEAIGIGTSIGKYRIPTGFDDLDGLIGGWSPPSLVVIGGRPASGKTSLMLHIARNASATHNITSMFVSSEESKNEIISRFLASAAKVPLLYMRGGQMSDEDWGNLAKGMIAASDAPFILNSCASLSLDEIAQEAGSIFDQSKVGALFIDGLLLLLTAIPPIIHLPSRPPCSA